MAVPLTSAEDPPPVPPAPPAPPASPAPPSPPCPLPPVPPPAPSVVPVELLVSVLLPSQAARRQAVRAQQSVRRELEFRINPRVSDARLRDNVLIVPRSSRWAAFVSSYPRALFTLASAG